MDGHCEVCFRRCALKENETGSCGARRMLDGSCKALYYGQITGLALDPIGKKPLNQFYPGSTVLSVGSLGCNLHCSFCQNHEISQRDADGEFSAGVRLCLPWQLAEKAEKYRSWGNIGVAYTYNEPLVCFEYVEDTAKLVREKGMKNVLVTNGCVQPWVLDRVSPYIDAMNIDLKGFTDRYYREVLKGDRGTVMDFIREAVKRCHVELTTLIVPGENDSEEEMLELSSWVASLTGVYGGKQGRDIPLHVSRFFPRYRMTDRSATDVKKVYALAEAAEKNLRYVYKGNC